MISLLTSVVHERGTLFSLGKLGLKMNGQDDGLNLDGLNLV